jgi:hypothetical protein
LGVLDLITIVSETDILLEDGMNHYCMRDCSDSTPLQKMSKNSGNGRFFSSGGDLKIYAPMFLSYSPPKIDFELAFFYLQHLQNFVSSFINFQGKMIISIRIQKHVIADVQCSIDSSSH